MSIQQISKVWTTVGLCLIYYTFNVWIVTQGGQEIFGAKLISTGRVPAALTGIPITCILLLIASLVGTLHARRTGPSWHNRIPIVGFESLDTSSREGRIYQSFMLIIVSLLPLIALFHFWEIVNNAPVVANNNPPRVVVGGVWDWSALTRLDDPARACTELIQEGGKIVCEKNTTVLPGLEPTIFAALTLFAAAAIALQLRMTFRGEAK